MNTTLQTAIVESLKYLIPTVLSFLIGWLSSKLRKAKQVKQDEEATRTAVLWVLRWVTKKSLIDDAKWYLENGITPEELKDFNDAYENYRTLGGNGEAKIYWEQVNRLQPKV